MFWRERFVAATRHLLVSLVLALMVAALVFGVWFPGPYATLAGGLVLFGILMCVDVVIGPLLTLAVFNPIKPAAELRRDIVIIVLLQLSALGYGVYSLSQARPVYLSYEGNRFRIVTPADIDTSSLQEAQAPLQTLGYSGPKLIGARLAESSDLDFQESILKSMAGFHPSYRPARWVQYDSVRDKLMVELLSIGKLLKKHPHSAELIREALTKHGLTEATAGYLPLDAEKASPVSWSVIVDRQSAKPMIFLPLDGW